jgi:tetratricopeptide (TPR) repeat protein
MAQTTKEKPQKKVTRSKKSEAQATLDRIQLTIEQNQKPIIGVIVVILVIVGGYFGYKNFIVAPKEEKANSALFSAERWFEVDSFKYVLNGDGIHQGGALNVIKKYSGTDAANLARYYAGMSYLHTGDAQNAIKQLAEFDGKKTPFQYLAYGAMGDAYMEMKNVAKGVEYYQKAAQNEKDNFISPLYLFRAGLASEINGKKEDAKKFYQEIKTKYPYSQQGRDIDKYLARIGDISMN